MDALLTFSLLVNVSGSMILVLPTNRVVRNIDDTRKADLKREEENKKTNKKNVFLPELSQHSALMLTPVEQV